MNKDKNCYCWQMFAIYEELMIKIINSFHTDYIPITAPYSLLIEFQ